VSLGEQAAQFDTTDESSKNTVKPLSSMVSFEPLLDKLKHIEASLMWLTASERRSSEKAQQNVQRHVQAERLKARLAKRKIKQEEKFAAETETETIDSIELETPRTAALTPRVDTTQASAVAAETQSAIKRTVNQVRAVIVDGVIWVTRLLEFGNQSTLSGQEDDGLNAFNECNQLLTYLKESSVRNDISDYCSSPWDAFSEFTSALPLLLLLKSREIKRGVASYFDFQSLMHGMNAMHADAFGAIGALMFGSMDHPEDQLSSSETMPSVPVVHREAVRQFINEAVKGHSGSTHLRILDLGCGMGTLLDDCDDEVQNRMDYVGVDMSQEAVAMARKRWCSEERVRGSSGRGKIRFVCQDIVENAEFEEEEFDVIVANDVFNFLPPSETLLVLSKLQTWLSSAGDIFISVPLISEKEEAMLEPKSLNFMCGIERSHPFIPGLFFRMFRPEEMQSMGAAVGLQARRVEIVEPPSSNNIPSAGPPVMTSSKSTNAWGGASGGGGGGPQEEVDKERIPGVGISTAQRDPTYRALLFIMEKK
jgi:SAM-dependent methyltransferase